MKSFLKNHDIDLNEYDKNGYNALHYAIKSEKPEIVKIFLNFKNDEENSYLAFKADPNKETKNKANQI